MDYNSHEYKISWANTLQTFLQIMHEILFISQHYKHCDGVKL